MGQKRAAVMYFTENGRKLAVQVKGLLESPGQGMAVQMGKSPGQSLQEWCQQAFEDAQLLVFIGAAGIAVRTIAPFVKDKFADPAVLVLDEKGRYVVPMLSGHVGGGNQWAAFLADGLSADAVITTATDLNGKFAVDVFASRQNLALTDRKLAKEISSHVLAGGQAGFYCEGGVLGKIPEELVWQDWGASLQGSLERSPQPGEEGKKGWKYQIYTGAHFYGQTENTLYLHPKSVAVGIGCKEGKGAQEIESFLCRVMEERHIAMESVFCLASIDRKKGEQGILEVAQKYQLPFYVFSAAELAEAPGAFTDSEFVKKVTGIGNVCERAAVLAAMGSGAVQGHGFQEKGTRLIVEKTAEHGVTLAFAEQEWSVVFE